MPYIYYLRISQSHFPFIPQQSFSHHKKRSLLNKGGRGVKKNDISLLSSFWIYNN
jgi:hypothetical protein